MFELSQEVSLIELALELAEARYNIMCAASGILDIDVEEYCLLCIHTTVPHCQVEAACTQARLCSSVYSEVKVQLCMLGGQCY